MLLPCYEFDELCYDEYTPFEKEEDKEHEIKHKLNYWGYGTKNTYYLAPKSSYASEAEHSDREFKEFVKKMHLAMALKCLWIYILCPGQTYAL